jgi:hypothetical protein
MTRGEERLTRGEERSLTRRVSLGSADWWARRGKNDNAPSGEARGVACIEGTVGALIARCRAGIRVNGRGSADYSDWTSLSALNGIECCVQRQVGLRKSLRKEVIQPQVLLRLPCYDLVPVTELAVGTTGSWRLRALPAPMT